MQNGPGWLARRLALPCGLAVFASIVASPTASAAAPAVSISPSSYNFGTVTVGSGASSPVFVLTNTGTADLHLQGPSITGANANDFSVSLNGCAYRTVSPGSTCQESANFNPKETGALSAALPVECPPAAVFEHPTARRLAHFLSDLTGDRIGEHTGELEKIG